MAKQLYLKLMINITAIQQQKKKTVCSKKLNSEMELQSIASKY